MDRPKRSKFLGQQCKIVYVPSIPDPDDPTKTLFGHWDGTSKSISIEDGLDHSREREILVHETLHQVFATSGLAWKDAQEELVVTFLAGALISHIQENQKFWKYVLEPTPPDEDD